MIQIAVHTAGHYAQDLGKKLKKTTNYGYVRWVIIAMALLSLSLGSGCAYKSAFSDALILEEAENASAVPSSEEISFPEGFEPEVIFHTASTALGTPYTRGGTSLNGFDCSGFVQWTYRQAGFSLPRTAREQARVGIPVAREELRLGDIVAFRHPRRGYHTGIYMGGGKFIHSPRARRPVSYDSLDDPYFSRTYLGARRVLPAADTAGISGKRSTSEKN